MRCLAADWRRGRDSNPCGVAPKRFSRPPRYDRFDTSPYMKLSFDRNHQIFNCFRNSFRNALLCCFRSAEKVRCYKDFHGFCVCSNRKFSSPVRYFSCGAFVIAKNPSTDIRSCMAGSFLHKVRRLALTSGILTHRCAFVKVYFIINAACRSLFFINFKNTLAFSENMW